MGKNLWLVIDETAVGGSRIAAETVRSHRRHPHNAPLSKIRDMSNWQRIISQTSSLRGHDAALRLKIPQGGI